MREPQIKVKTEGTSAKVFINGEKLDGVRKISFELEAGKVPYLELKMLACDLEVDGQFKPVLPEIYETWYVEKEPEYDELLLSEKQKVDSNVIGFGV